MGKIIRCNETTIVIGMDDNTVKEVRTADCNFEPKLGDKVEVFESETYVIVSRVEESTEERVVSIPQKENGININITNDNSHRNDIPGAYGGSGKVVKKSTYLLLCFFLGGLGIHKFYVGKTVVGICYILFCWTWVPLILSIIDFIIGCCKESDAYGNIII